jgi:hypothetical protein
MQTLIAISGFVIFFTAICVGLTITSIGWLLLVDSVTNCILDFIDGFNS